MNHQHVYRIASALLISLATSARAQDSAPTVPIGASDSATHSDETEVYLAFAEEVASTLSHGDATFFDSSIDPDALVARATRGENARAGPHDVFMTSFRASFKPEDNITADLMENDGIFVLLRMIAGDEPRALFRSVSDAGLDYFECTLQLGENGVVRIVDLFSLVLGEPFSKTIRRGYALAMSADDVSLLDRILGKESAYMASLDDIIQFNRDHLPADGCSRAGTPRTAAVVGLHDSPVTPVASGWTPPCEWEARSPSRGGEEWKLQRRPAELANSRRPMTEHSNMGRECPAPIHDGRRSGARRPKNSEHP